MQKFRQMQHISSELGRIFAVKLLTSSVYLAPEETNSQICQKNEIMKFKKKRFDIFIWNALLCFVKFCLHITLK